ncbi:uncharacterized protein LOC144435644 [Glandiceps talaboti]
MSLIKKIKPRFSFGVIADVQYADSDNKMNFTQTKWRYYRSSLKLLRDAVQTWNQDPSDVSFVVNLGDTIDARNLYEGSRETSKTALNAVLDEFRKFSGKVHHVLGNHDVYNFKKDELLLSDLYSGPQTSPQLRNSYYDFSPHEGFRFVVLDNYDIAMLGYEEGSSIYEQAKAILEKKNRNKDKNSPQGLQGLDRRFVQFNGAMSKCQLQWLDGILQSACDKEEKVVLFGHTPIHPSASSPICLQWNYDEVLEIIHKYNCVVAYFCGHEHEYSLGTDHGIHHILMDGIIEVEPDSNSYAIVDVYSNKVVMRGFGLTPTLEIEF